LAGYWPYVLKAIHSRTAGSRSMTTTLSAAPCSTVDAKAGTLKLSGAVAAVASA
jgi:hypothetical protein